MFCLNDSNRFFLYPRPTDMRKSFYTLSGIVTNQMGRCVQDGDAFIFINKSCTTMKILHMECGGLAIYCLKLERGYIHLPDTVSEWEGKTAVDGRYRIDNNLVENGQRPVAVGRRGDLFCGNDDAAVMYSMMGCCKAAGVNVYDWLVYFLSHVHEYDSDYTRDLAELLPGNLLAKSLVKPVGETPASL